jgi:AmiR/NasT family two-component response regulator
MPIRIEDSLIGRVVREAQARGRRGCADGKLYRYPELARKAGLASLLSVPLLTSHGVIGTLNIYLRNRRSFTKEDTLFAQALAGQAAMALENARLMSESLEIKRTLETRKIVERAKGILQQRDGLTEEEAYLHLRSESRRMRRPMRNLAEAVILGGRTPPEEPS